MSHHQSTIQAAGGIVWKNSRRQKLAVVHRPKHQDWSLPKGKLDRDESWQEAALREVLEETGYQCQLMGFAGSIAYLIEGTPKVILYWHMDAAEHCPECMNGEVDEVRWLTCQEALELLDYEDEKELIRSKVSTRIKGT
jgi:8-oxo-dGTP diphosphatase